MKERLTSLQIGASWVIGVPIIIIAAVFLTIIVITTTLFEVTFK